MAWDGEAIGDRWLGTVRRSAAWDSEAIADRWLGMVRRSAAWDGEAIDGERRVTERR